MQRRTYTHEEWEEFYKSEREFHDKWSGVLILDCPDCGERYDECYCIDED